MAEIIAVGPGGVVDGKEVSMYVKAGQKIIYSKLRTEYINQDTH